MGPIGVPELIFIFIIALVVFGPKKLPELGKSLGKGLREFNKAKNELKATWDEQIREAENSLNSVKEPVRKTIASVHEPAPEAKSDPDPTPSHPETQGEPPHSPPAGTEA